jgi:5'-nucleotidase
MQYDVATMGNHDFDIGMEGFKNAQRFANFPFVCSNYDFKHTTLANQTLPYHILKRGGVKIGFFGIGVNLDGLSPASCYAGMNYIDPIARANEMAQKLSDLGCDLVVCLSHLGFDYSSTQVSDKVLAAQTANIHLILGGHTHTFMEHPLIMENASKKPVLINQTGWAGLFLGRIDIDFQGGMFKHQALLVQ